MKYLIMTLILFSTQAMASVPIQDLRIISEKTYAAPLGRPSYGWREGGGWGRRGGYEGGWGRQRAILFHIVSKKPKPHGDYPSPQMGKA